MGGDFDEVLDSWRLVDCRYPYEYINGHLLVRTVTIFLIYQAVHIGKEWRKNGEVDCMKTETNIYQYQ